MKKWSLICFLALCVAVLMLPAQAAVSSYGVYDIEVKDAKVIAFTPLDGAGNAVTESRIVSVNGEDKPVFDGTEGFRLTFSGTPGNQYVVFLLQGASSAPTQDNTRYTAQQTGAANTTFELWPNGLAAGEYHVYLSGTDMRYQEAVSFCVMEENIPGDVDRDGSVTTADAGLVLQHITKQNTLTGEALSAAELDGGAGITALDAALILQKAGALPDTYPAPETEGLSAALAVTAGQGASRAGLLPGDQVTVSLVLTEVPLCWSALQAEVRYDPAAFSPVGDSVNSCCPELAALFGEENVQVNTALPGRFLIAACGGISTAAAGPGAELEAVTVLRAVFTVKAGAPAGETLFSVVTGDEEPDGVSYGAGFVSAGGCVAVAAASDDLREAVVLAETGVTYIAAPAEDRFPAPEATLGDGAVTAGERTVRFGATVIGNDGREDFGGVSWSLVPAGAGVTVDASGVIHIASDAVAQRYTLTAAPKTSGIKGAETVFTVTKDAPAVGFVTLAPSKVVVDSFAGGTALAAAYDQYGAVIPVAWHLFGGRGVTVEADGTITAAAGAPAGEVTVAAEDSGGQTAQAILTVESLTPSEEQVTVNWAGEVILKDPAVLTYGADPASAFAQLPASGTATVETRNGVQTLTGTYSLRGSGTLSAGSRTLTVVFTVIQEGAYQGMRFSKDYSVTVRAARASGSVTITGETFQVGEPLTATVRGAVDSVHWVWYHSEDPGTPIGWGARYTPQESDAGKSLVAVAVCTGNYVGRLTSRPVEIQEAEVPPEEEAPPEELPPEELPVTAGEVLPLENGLFLVQGAAIGQPVKVTVPTERPGLGTVAVVVYSDGTERILTDSLPTSGGVTATAPTGAFLRLRDGSKVFSDVNDWDWYAGALSFTSAREILNGREDGRFDPVGTLNRAMMAQILYNLAGRPQTEAADVFLDVSADDWFAEAVVWGTAIGVITGYGDDTYRPEEPVTREQMIVMLCRCCRYFGREALADGGNFYAFADDHEVSAYAVYAMAWAVESGVVNGIPKEDGTLLLRPKGETLRAQAAQVIMNYCQYLWSP